MITSNGSSRLLLPLPSSSTSPNNAVVAMHSNPYASKLLIHVRVSSCHTPDPSPFVARAAPPAMHPAVRTFTSQLTLSIADAVHTSINERADMLILAFSTVVGFLRRRDSVVLWGLFGATINHLLSKFLKRIIKQPRPGITADFVTPEDCGMPSSHAQTLTYLSVYACFGGFLGKLDLRDVADCCKVGALLSIATYLAWLRVREGNHSACQVLAGCLIGAVFAALWLCLYKATFLPCLM